MQVTRIHFSEDARTKWAGYGDFILVSPDGSHTVDLIYKGEPPHGDSYHTVAVDGCPLPGMAWGCLFGFSACSRYLAFSWMARRIERKTMVVDMVASYRFTGSEDWSAY